MEVGSVPHRQANASFGPVWHEAGDLVPVKGLDAPLHGPDDLCLALLQRLLELLSPEEGVVRLQEVTEWLHAAGLGEGITALLHQPKP